MNRSAVILFLFGLAVAPILSGDTVTTTAGAGSTATYNGYYSWGGGADWSWVPGGAEAHYYSDCYPCYFWDNSRLFIEFVLPMVSGTITGATLYLDITAYQNYNPGAANLYHQPNSSALTGNAYNDHASLSASELVQGITVPGAGWLAIPVTSFIASDYSNGYSYSTFALLPTGNGYGNSLLRFADTGTATAPYLSITTDADMDAPEPASLSLAALAAATLLGLRRRRLI